MPRRRRSTPEFAWSYEGGLKRTMADGRIRANTAVFYTTYKDLQVLSFVRPGVPEISNAGAATIKGVEIEVAAALGRDVHLASQVSWLDATYDQYLARVPGSPTLLDAAGNRLNNAPEWSGGGSAVYVHAAGGRGTVTLRGDVTWQSRVFFEPFNDDIETQRQVWAPASARSLRAEEPPLGTGLLRAQHGQPGVHHQRKQRAADSVRRPPGRSAALGYRVHPPPLTKLRRE